MTSSSFVLDTDDGFDWEAAVREIDTACERASNQQSLAPPPAARTPMAAEPVEQCPRAPKPNPNGKGRQSTLDRFVDSFTKRKSGSDRSSRPCIYKTPNVDCTGYDNPGAEGGESAVSIDLEAAQTWIYPVNVPLRDYQFAIAKVALFSNTLVALPTGLGKTLVAAVVMYNYFRWFPEGKIVFTAPSRPLVLQQIEACHNMVGIPQEWAIDMTGQMSPLKRSSFWKTKRVFFVTPQVLEKDIQSGICSMRQIVCLVIDEAHRALGNYSYCVAVRELMAVPVQLRILALTATPGSKQHTIQNVIDNLGISTLEYRNETDHDVSPYVHNRTLELIEVEMGKDATNINNLLLEAVKPFATKLLSCGLLYNRDLATLSPCELLNLREKYRQAPPRNFDQKEKNDVEGRFGMLITLYHIRKLLTGHGVRPAYEMLDEKLRSGPFAKQASRNETIMKAKLLMQRSLSHGAPSPKLVKLIEILTEHFKANDPRNSRVIIFSNFRGSVRDIMDSLSSIGDWVKATEFIGQSSGKTLKGQTQKMQQSVLQKFRTGGYNVIVATSIGEEGLDIMEVDLVICFDANVSPLRMIQRMGRTGRKHDGRVVVLATEGFEVKAYKRKQATSRAVRKHMHNGGIKSFSFHSSPRMVPHVCKPQAQFVEFSIEQFVPRGKKSKDDSNRSPVSEKLLDEEKDIIARYFHPDKEDMREPSLIAFPIFQTFPSSVHELRHSFRTTAMLIDAMQNLQGLAQSKATKSLIEGGASYQSPEAATVAVENNEQEHHAFSAFCNVTNTNFEENYSVVEELEEPLKETPEANYGPQIACNPSQKYSSHCFLFGEDFVNVNSLGGVIIASVPRLPHKGAEVLKLIPSGDSKEYFINTINEACSFMVSAAHCGKRTTQVEDVAEAQVVPKRKLYDSEGVLASQSRKYSVQSKDSGEKFVPESPVSKQKLMNQENSVAEATVNTENVLQGPLVFESDGTLNDIQLSPRLTHFIEEGIVPESPAVNQNHSKAENVVSSNVTPRCVRDGLLAKSQSPSIQGKKDLFVVGSCSIKDESCELLHAGKFSGVSSEDIVNSENCGLVNIQTSCEKITKRNMLYSPINEDIRTPLVNSISNSSSENWQQNSAEASKSLLPAPQYKRLKKYGDIAKRLSCETMKEKEISSLPNTRGHGIRNRSNQAGGKKDKMEKIKKNVTSLNAFVEEEAEVSQDAEVSEDEEDDEHEDEYDDSFIDDRINPTEASTEVETSGDMMAFYRRSLLTQSPAECLQNCMTTPRETFSSRAAETESCSSEKVCDYLQTPQNGLQSGEQSCGRQSVSHQVDLDRTALVCENSAKGSSTKLESRKRKLSFQYSAPFTAAKFLVEHGTELEPSGKVSQQKHPGNTGIGTNLLCDDDDFYQSLDLDAVEEQATKLLRHKSGLADPNNSVQIKEDLDLDFLCSPSFDLGI